MSLLPATKPINEHILAAPKNRGLGVVKTLRKLPHQMLDMTAFLRSA